MNVSAELLLCSTGLLDNLGKMCKCVCFSSVSHPTCLIAHAPSNSRYRFSAICKLIAEAGNGSPAQHHTSWTQRVQKCAMCIKHDKARRHALVLVKIMRAKHVSKHTQMLSKLKTNPSSDKRKRVSVSIYSRCLQYTVCQMFCFWVTSCNPAMHWLIGGSREGVNWQYQEKHAKMDGIPAKVHKR